MNSVPTRYRASFERRIQALKEAVPVARYAAEITSLKNFGGALRGPCPVHGGGNPTSFSVRPEAGRAHCFACGFDGDILGLFMAVENYADDEKAFAVQALADRYSVELPSRPRSWHRKQERQKPVRDGIELAKVHAARRRLYRRFFEPLVLGSEDPEDRAHDSQAFWEATKPLAERLVDGMMAGSRR